MQQHLDNKAARATIHPQIELAHDPCCHWHGRSKQLLYIHLPVELFPRIDMHPSAKGVASRYARTDIEAWSRGCGARHGDGLLCMHALHSIYTDCVQARKTLTSGMLHKERSHDFDTVRFHELVRASLPLEGSYLTGNSNEQVKFN